MNLPAKDHMEWHDVLNNPPAGPPLLRIGLCIQRIEAAAGLTIGFIERIEVRGSRKWSTQTICAASGTRGN